MDPLHRADRARLLPILCILATAVLISAVPNPPRNFEVASFTNDSVSFDWNRPAASNGTVFNGTYAVFYSESGSNTELRFPANASDGIAQTSATVTDLLPNTTYIFFAIAQDASGDSDPTDNVTQTTAAPIEFVDVAPNVTVTCNSTDAIAPPNVTGGCDTPQLSFDDSVRSNLTCRVVASFVRTWTAVDSCGQSASINQTVQVTDPYAPVLTLPDNATVACDADTAPSATGRATATHPCGAGAAGARVNVTFTDDASGNAGCPTGGAILRTWTATDCAGNSVSGVQMITLQPTTTPNLTITAPPDATVPCNASTLPAATGTATTDGGCPGNVTVTFADSAVDVCPGAQNITRTWTATDSCNNTANATQLIVVTNTFAPNLTVPADASVPCGGNITTAALGVATATDLCAPSATVPVVFRDVQVNGSCGPLRRIWTAIGGCGTNATGVQLITFTPVASNLTITAPPDATVPCNASTLPAATGTATTDGGCPGNVTVTFADSAVDVCPGAQNITRTWTATDSCNATANATQLIVVTNTFAPNLTVPADASVPCGGNITTAALGVATATDLCAPNATVPVVFQDVQANGTCGTVQRIWTAIGGCGTNATATQTITFTQVITVNLTVPANATVECDADTTPDALGTATATSDCGIGKSNITFADTRTNGSCPQDYVITRTWTAVDRCGNSATGVQTITVQDTIPPNITAPADITLDCPDTSVAVTGRPTASDACGMVTVTHQDIVSNRVCPLTFDVTRVFTATDECGNTATANQTILVRDTTAPTMCVPPDVTIDSSDSVDPASTGTPSVFDGCNNKLSVTFSDSRTNGSCPQDYVITRTWVAADACGLNSTAVQTITVQDTQPPVLSVPANVVVECGADTSPSATGNANAVDNADPAPTVTFSDALSAPGCGGVRNITRTWTATDACGNNATGVQTIAVVLTQPPELTVPASVTLACGADTSVAALGSANATSSCTTATVTVTSADTPINGSCSGGGSLVRTWTATDSCGNTVSANQTIILGEAPPATPGLVLTAPPDLTQSCTESTETNHTGRATAVSSCGQGVVTVSFSDSVAPSGTCHANRVITRTWTATDGCGNTETAVQTITVVDNALPALAVPPNLSLQCAGNTGVKRAGSASATDNCDSSPSVDFTDVRTSQGCANRFTIVREWTATDSCGLTTQLNQTIVVDDTTAPRVCVPADVTVQCDGSTDPADTGTAAAADNCGGDVTVAFNDTRVAGSCPQSFVIMRTWTATDVCGNVGTAVQKITVVDTQPPTITAPPAATAECAAAAQPAQTGTATATDNCDSAPSITFVDSAVGGSCELTGSFVRTWTATDACGNSASANQTIRLRAPAPSISAPPRFEVTCVDAGSLDPNVTGQPDVTAACGANSVSVTFSDRNRTLGCSAEMVITRTWTVTDTCGRTDSDDQTIEVTSLPPVYTPPSQPLCLVPGNGSFCWANVVQSDSFIDASGTCDVAIDQRAFVRCTSDQGGAAQDCTFNATTGTLCMRAGGVGNATTDRTYTAFFEIRDACGNTLAVNQSVVVPLSANSTVNTSTCLAANTPAAFVGAPVRLAVIAGSSKVGYLSTAAAAAAPPADTNYSAVTARPLVIGGIMLGVAVAAAASVTLVVLAMRARGRWSATDGERLD